jgi:hypothetical protein
MRDEMEVGDFMNFPWGASARLAAIRGACRIETK